jgi:hypothetical protein
MNFTAQLYSAFTSELSKIADMDKEANDLVASPSAAQRLLAASKEMHPSAGAEKMMPPFKPLHSLKGTTGSRIGKALGGLMGRVR